jgi:PAS domain S-box-containing protein
MFIANILLVGFQDTSFEAMLTRHGYGCLHAISTDGIIAIEKPFAIMILHESMAMPFGAHVAERLYFMNNSVPIAVLIENPLETNESLCKSIREGTLEVLYRHEIDTGLILGRIDRMFLSAQFDRTIQLHQQSLREKEALRKELTLREQILTHERVINTNILASITSGIMILDLLGAVVLSNRHMHELLPGMQDDVIGAQSSDVLPQELQSLVISLMNDLQHEYAGNVMKKIKINERYLDVSGYRILDYQNNPTGMLLLAQDITEQEQISIQLFRSEKLATVGTMLSGIAHELRNPLSIISARAQRAITKHETEWEKIQKAFESIEAQAQRCAVIVNSLLDFTRQTATQTGYHLIADILNETLTYVDYQNLFDNITITKDYTSDLQVFGDRSRYVQVFLNIISNAADAMNGKGTLDIKTRIADNGHTQIEICDNGPGIPLELENKLFDPFFTTKDPGKGTGLGLAIVYKITQQSAGRVWFKSCPGRTSFFVNLPSIKDRTYEQQHSIGR